VPSFVFHPDIDIDFGARADGCVAQGSADQREVSLARPRALGKGRWVASHRGHPLLLNSQSRRRKWHRQN
jgi:hypothetical protein